ncbi:ionotropic receptor 75a [Leptinotarsa decemlineata]|uniref:ionotropic receptor 75a n=1 Tax=Leptinotarsa decemlineata TaxID=7539 RepID=UPI003D30828E
MSFLKSNFRSEYPKMIKIRQNVSSQELEKFFRHSPTSNWFVMDFINCKNVDYILNHMNVSNLFRYPLKHLFLLDISSYYRFLSKIKYCDVFPMSEVFVAVFDHLEVNIYQPYKIRKPESLTLEHYGNWSSQNGLTYFYKNIPTTSRRRNFHKSEVIVSVVVNNNKSFEVANFDDFAEAKADEPYFFQDFPNVYSLLQYMNASFTFRVFTSYGYLNETTGKFDGMVNYVSEGKADIAGTALFLTEERHKVVEFIKTFDSWGSKFILKKPSMSYIENIYWMTFTNKVWIASIIILIIFGTFLFYLLNWEKRKSQSGRRTYTVSDITLMSFEAVCQQGTYIDSATYSGRLMIFMLFTAFMFLYVAYSAYILVLLQSTKPISSIRRLVDSRIECGGLNISFMMPYYHLTKDEALKDLYSKKIHPNQFFTLEDGLRKVQDGNFAFQVILGPAYNYILKTYTNYDICKLQELSGFMNAKMYVAVPKSSQYKKIFKIGLLRVEESGLQIRTKNRVSMKPKCYNEGEIFSPSEFTIVIQYSYCIY